MSDLVDLIQLARSKQHTVVLAEAADERMIRAARILAEQEIASPILTGDEERIRSIANSVNVSLDGIGVVDPAADTNNMNRYIALCADGRRPIDPATAQDLMQETLMYSAMMVKSGDAHAMIAGSSVTTASVIQAGLKIIGTAENVKTASSYFLMDLSGSNSAESRHLIFADCAVNINPTAEQLVDIACETAQNAKFLLNDEPRIAFLSFSTKGSARHEIVSKVASAVDLTKERLPDMLIDGELQFDAAFDQGTASRKLKETGPVAGQANVFIFPDLNAGNIGYKLTQYLAGAQAIGPILQGFARPISDLSRGASVDDIVKTTVVLLATIE